MLHSCQPFHTGGRPPTSPTPTRARQLGHIATYIPTCAGLKGVALIPPWGQSDDKELTMDLSPYFDKWDIQYGGEVSWTIKCSWSQGTSVHTQG